MFSNTSKYATRALIYLELHASSKRKVGLKKIAEDLDIPQPFLGKILQVLVKSGQLESEKGPGGGFALKRSAFDISLIEVIELFDGSDLWNSCAIRTTRCDHGAPCSLHHRISPLREQLRSRLATESIGDLVKEYRDGREEIRI